MMTVSDLIEKLRELPGDMPVLSGGGDSPLYRDAEELRVAFFVPVDDQGHYVGAYQISDRQRARVTGEPFQGLRVV